MTSKDFVFILISSVFCPKGYSFDIELAVWPETEVPAPFVTQYYIHFIEQYELNEVQTGNDLAFPDHLPKT